LRKRARAPRIITPYTGRFQHRALRFLTIDELTDWYTALDAAMLKKHTPVTREAVCPITGVPESWLVIDEAELFK
jgi:hypothetical protein